MFAEELLVLGGRLVVVPSRDCRPTVVEPDHAPAFGHFLEAAAEVVILPNGTAGRNAYEAARAAGLEAVVVRLDGAARRD
ncbi:hypothetical protein [Kitasatospora sp. NPDC088346]|uniref:hypothetical protein n=1 Tax=Kitasatospora sp. NPDC088346 TaxID=3364073 RepID=UPI003819B35A